MKLPDPPYSFKQQLFTERRRKFYQLSYVIYMMDDSVRPIPVGVNYITLPKNSELEQAYDTIIHIETDGRRFIYWTKGFSADFVNLIKSTYKLNIWKSMK